MSTTTPHTQTAYKDTTIGKIPADWEVKKLGDVIKLGNGKDYKHLNNGDIPVWGTGGIITYVDDYLFDGLSIGIGRKGSIDKPVLLSGKFWTVDTLFYVNEFKGIEVEFAFNLFNSINWMKYNEATGLPSLSQKNILNIQIPLPPLPEQKRIAEVLSTWDQAIQLTEQLIRQKEQRKKWLMQNLLTGKMRLKGFSGEWKECKLGDFIEESRIPSIHNDVNRRITVKLNLKGVEKREVRGSEAEDATYFFIRKKGQFIYGKQNLHKGAFGIIPEELDGFESSQDIPSFDFKENVIPKFFLLFMSQEQFYKSLEKISTGTGSKRIHPENLYKVKVKFPSLEEQTAIAEILQTADKEIELLKAKAEQLKEQKKGLMQQLLTGKKRLL